MNIHIREINSNEYKVLDDFLYKAIFFLGGVEAPPREIINAPELQVYVHDFGKQEGYLFCCRNGRTLYGGLVLLE